MLLLLMAMNGFINVSKINNGLYDLTRHSTAFYTYNYYLEEQLSLLTLAQCDLSREMIRYTIKSE